MQLLRLTAVSMLTDKLGLSRRVCDYLFFFFNDTATTEIYTLSLHDALPICRNSQAPASSLVVGFRDRAWCGCADRSRPPATSGRVAPVPRSGSRHAGRRAGAAR